MIRSAHLTRLSVFIALLSVAWPNMVAAQDMPGMAHAPAHCTAPAILPEAMASWAHPSTLKGGASARDAKAAALVAGQAVILALHLTPKIAYAVRPAKPGGSVSYGGIASFTVQKAGTWRVALGSGAWIDVIKGKKAIASTAHGHGPDCSGIRKMVDYSLQPGRYILQIAANGDDTLPVLVTHLP
jgi:microcystin degradation protein MlrC